MLTIIFLAFDLIYFMRFYSEAASKENKKNTEANVVSQNALLKHQRDKDIFAESHQKVHLDIFFMVLTNLA